MMTDTLKKINLYNKHFAHISKTLFQRLEDKKGKIDISSYIKKKAKNDFGITIKSIEDVDRLSEIIEDNFYANTSEWLKEKIRNDLRLPTYPLNIDEMICLDDIRTHDDVKKVNEMGYLRIHFTADEFKKRFPELDTKKVFTDNLNTLPHLVYYDEDKFAMVELNVGFPPAVEHIPENMTMLTAEGFEGTPGQYILEIIDYIYETLQSGDYQLYTFMNMKFYRNEILDFLIMKTDDVSIKRKLRRCKEIDD